MATMVKEKRREKKRSKEKHAATAVQPTTTNIPLHEEISPSVSKIEKTLHVNELPGTEAIMEEQAETNVVSVDDSLNERLTDVSDQYNDKHLETVSETSKTEKSISLISFQSQKASETIQKCTILKEFSESCKSNEYNDLNARLERIHIPTTVFPISKEREESLEAAGAYIKEEIGQDAFLESGTVLEESVVEANEDVILQNNVLEDLSPSAPMFEFEEPHIAHAQEAQSLNREIPKLISMSLEEAINLYGGKEMSEVMAMSVKEEAAVESGPLSGPEHPLVDLLSTFKRSLIALERECIQMALSLKEEEKLRNSLWKIEKRGIYHYETCPSCGRSVTFRGKYEVATLNIDKLEVARVRLDGLLRDLQDSYCHHQHAALLAYCQIEEFLTEVIRSNKGEIREALTLVLQALRLGDGAPAALTGALQLWAAALAAALLHGRDLRQLLFLIHHLFRQTRSVRWAARALDVHVGDSAARAIAVLDLLLARPAVDAAVECTEDKEEDWEEVDKDGGGGAVSDGSLRERDMLALLRAQPLQELVARLVLFSQADIRTAREWSWGDSRGGGDVIRACCGVRALLHVTRRAAHAQPRYTRVRRALHRLALSAVTALHALHDHARPMYAKDMEIKVQAELEAVFASGLGLLDPGDLPRLPAALLSHHAARDYCISHIVHLHESSSTRLESLSIELAPLACDVRVRIVAQAAVDRAQDHELARIVLEFLFTVGVRRSTTVTCAGACQRAARDALPQLLAAHAHLYSAVLLLIADTSTVEKIEPCVIDWVRVSGWRPGPGEAAAVADDWARRCPHLLPPLLLKLDCTPHTGLSLESQLSIGSWLCAAPARRAGEAEWRWAGLLRLRVHRATWRLPPDAPPPDPEPASLLAEAYALMASSWGHCVPMICSEGVAALCSLAAYRVSLALHCLAPIMLLLAPAHESIALTPRFSELFATVVNASPSLVQRALGRGGESGADLLLRLVMEQLSEDHCGGIPRELLGRAWTAALWRPSLAPAAALLDCAMASRRLRCLDDHATHLARAQDEESIQLLSQATQLSSTAPLVCCAALSAWHTQRELLPGLHPRLLDALHSQRLTAQRIHVDNALKLIGASIGAEELVVYRCANAVLSAPAQHPACLQLWRLFMHLYLQRPPADMRNTTAPVGPLFFSGLVKSRTLAQLKRRLQDCITYHTNEATTLAEAAKRSPKPTTSRISGSESRTNDNILFSRFTITDLTGESSDSSEPDSDWSDGEEEKKIESKEESPSEIDVVDNTNLTAYHTGAKRLLSAYAQWLEEGARTVAVPHLADISRFIPESAQEAAWKKYSASKRPPSSPLDEREPFPLPPSTFPPAPPPPPTPFQRAVDTLLSIKNRSSRSRRRTIRSSIEDVDFKDSRSLLALIDKHLKDIERLSQEWSAEVSRISALDAALWRLVGGLRVARPLPAMTARCANRCDPLHYLPPEQEWCKSIDAERGIKENRSAALAGMRRLARPRPHAARTAAALLAIARRMPDGGVSRAVSERAWRAAAVVAPSCPPAATPLTAFFELLAERWLSGDGPLCASLVRAWCGGGLGALQRALVPALVCPARLPPARQPALLAALLRAALPPHVAFSCLSKFDMGRWAASVDGAERLEVLATLRQAMLRWGGDGGDKEQDMVAELIGVQSVMVCGPGELAAHIRACSLLMAEGEWPASRSAHLVAAAQRVAHCLPLDQLGHLLRELGAVWWEVRTRGRGRQHDKLPVYAPHVAALLHTLHRAFVNAAVQLSYAPERVAAYAWGSLAEAWGAWVQPHATPPLLPAAAHDACARALHSFREAVDQVMTACPGTEEYLLNHIWEWTVQSYLGVQTSGGQESRVQLSALLGEQASLPWTSCQWLRGTSLQGLVQVCQLADKDMCSWCSSCCSSLGMSSWLRDATHDQLPARLALLLHLFTCAPLQLPDQILEEATTLPWHRLPELALEEALDRFFMEHHGLAIPYHDLPQFKVILAASEIVWSSQTGLCVSAGSRQKRARLVSSWLRAASSPALAQHVPAAQRAVLAAVHAAAPHLENSEGEVEDMLSRAMVIMCIEPAATAALPVWVRWVRAQRSARLARASARAAAVLTAFEYFAPLADAALAACLANTECGGWASVHVLLSDSPWREAAPLCARARLHAAYGTLLAHAHAPAAAQAALLALLAADIDFVENEVMVAVWICAACRLARVSSDESGESGGSGERDECRNAAAALLGRWAEPARRSFLKIVTLQAGNDLPQPRHRALCSLAMCVVWGGAGSWAREFEAACAALPPACAAAPAAWARRPHARRLPRLAARLFPAAEPYFRYELDAAPPDPLTDRPSVE